MKLFLRSLTFILFLFGAHSNQKDGQLIAGNGYANELFDNSHISPEIHEAFSDDLIIARKAKNEKNYKSSIVSQQSALNWSLSAAVLRQKPCWPYPLTRVPKQEAGYGFLFLLMLF